MRGHSWRYFRHSTPAISHRAIKNIVKIAIIDPDVLSGFWYLLAKISAVPMAPIKTKTINQNIKILMAPPHIVWMSPL